MGADLRRDLDAATGRPHHLIVVGGGIYGATLALEAARRGLAPLLIERDDFGGATSWNSHRIVHGGLRYLQRLDLSRFRTSVRERSWFLRSFPDLVEPLPCLMPLYGHGMRRPSLLRAALLANHLLSLHRNDGLRSDRRLESGGVLTALETVSLYPDVTRRRLRGGALWYDAVMRDSQRLLVEILRWAAARGALCLNYVEATGLRVQSGAVRGIEARDRVAGVPLAFEAGIVVNCAGPWSGDVAARLDREVPELFTPSLAFNLLFDRQPPSEVALALSAPRPGAHTWFMYPRETGLYVGTAHFPCPPDTRESRPSREQIDAVIGAINEAAPGLDLRRHQLLRVHAGLLPARASAAAELTARPVIHAHGAAGGPDGLISVSGVKYTTARDVAERTLRAAFGAELAGHEGKTDRPAAAVWPELDDLNALDAAIADDVRRLAAAEAVVHLADLLLRRGRWGQDPARARRLAPAVARALGWNEARTRQEIDRLEAELARATPS